jgi:hypothetical protein
VRLPSWWNYETIGNAFNVLLVVSLLSAFGLAAVAAMPEEPQEYPGHRPHWGFQVSEEFAWEHYKEPLEWYEVVEAMQSCLGITLDEMHPESFKALNWWFKGMINFNGLKYYIGLPNSDYIDAPMCMMVAIRRGRKA